ncbi:PREDICTED: phragmoplast orienting kinesin 2-like [Populus euphratica]|uniref:Phragmoplast orienting kinesin 2-like n=1 Tax=Populus euphratica TaxID=75702 RepID=A0AAJ6SWH4_POPEU|nr:PREDICTED: phragmoplast orienting kinesin 2-like [Populus euphratica]
MVEQVKPEGHFTHCMSSSSNKSEKNAAKFIFSDSPFTCIGLGLAQQIKYEKDEDLAAARLRIEELESLAVNRQKEEQEVMKLKQQLSEFIEERQGECLIHVLFFTGNHQRSS